MVPYEALTVQIQRARREGWYEAVVRSPSGGEGRAEFEVPFDEDAVELFVHRVVGGVRGRRGGGPLEEAVDQAEEFGGKLFQMLFHGHAGETYRSSLRAAEEGKRGLRITLDLNSVPELTHLPWEYMYDKPWFLCVRMATQVVRYLELPSPPKPLKADPPLRILAMVSSPEDYPELDVEAERNNLKRSLASLTARGLMELEFLEDASLRALHKKLFEREYHVFHFIGHGDYDNRGQYGRLVLETQDGKGEPVSGERLADILCDEGVKLAVLNACEGARTSSDDPFAGVAASLVGRNMPAVIAMQFEITDEAALTFAEYFYDAIATGYPVDSALAHSRKGILASHRGLEWGTPVLFMRVPDGGIFAVDWDKARASKPAISLELEPDPPAVAAGEPVTWRLLVTNVGEARLKEVAPYGDDGLSLASPVALDSGKQDRITWRSTPAESVDTTITVRGVDEHGRSVSEQVTAVVAVRQDEGDRSVEAAVGLETARRPRISVTLEPEPTQVEPGGRVNWQMTVKNTSDSALSSVLAVRDDEHLLEVPTLPPRQSHTVTWSSSPETSREVTVGVSAVDPFGRSVKAEAAAQVRVHRPTALFPLLKAYPEKVAAGEEVTWRLDVVNTGEQPLRGVRAIAEDGTVLAGPIDLQDGAREAMSWTQVLTSDVVNKVTLCGSDPTGHTVSEHLWGRAWVLEHPSAAPA